MSPGTRRIDYVRTVIQQLQHQFWADPEFLNGLDMLPPEEWDAVLR